MKLFIVVLLFTLSKLSFSVNKVSSKPETSMFVEPIESKTYQAPSPTYDYTDTQIHKMKGVNCNEKEKIRTESRYYRQAQKLCELMNSKQGKHIEKSLLEKIIYALIKPEDKKISAAKEQQALRIINEISDKSVLRAEFVDGGSRKGIYCHIYSQSRSLQGHPNYRLTSIVEAKDNISTMHFSYSRRSPKEDDEVYLGLLVYLALSYADDRVCSSNFPLMVSLDDTFMLKIHDEERADFTRLNTNEIFVKSLLNNCIAIQNVLGEIVAE